MFFMEYSVDIFNEYNSNTYNYVKIAVANANKNKMIRDNEKKQTSKVHKRL